MIIGFCFEDIIMKDNKSNQKLNEIKITETHLFEFWKGMCVKITTHKHTDNT